MKKIVLIIGLIVAANILMAQEKRAELKEKRQLKIEAHRERLQLTDDQTAELKKMRESLRPELDKIRADDSKSKSEKIRARADIVERNEIAIANILTEDQLTELKIIRQEVRLKREQRLNKRRKHRKKY